MRSTLSNFVENKWVLLVLRVVPAFVLALFAFGKAIEDHGVFYEAVRQYQLLPDASVPFLASALIYIELIVGVLLLVGLFTRPMAFVASLLLLMFIVFIVQAILRGIPLADCGCSGGFISLGETPAEVLTRDLLMLASLAWVAAAKTKSALRLDLFFEDSHGNEI